MLPHNATTTRIVLVATIAGLVARLLPIGRPFWIDEVLLLNMANAAPLQEFLPISLVLAQRHFGLISEFWIRLPYVIAGTLTILAVYKAVPWRSYACAAAVLIAIAPIFVHWSTLARPYALAGMFVALGYRWPVFYAPALLTTPVAIVGLNLHQLRTRWPWYLLFVVMAITLFHIRPDADRGFFNWRFVYDAKRMWYLPLLSLVLHLPAICRRWERPLALRLGLARRACGLRNKRDSGEPLQPRDEREMVPGAECRRDQTEDGCA